MTTVSIIPTVAAQLKTLLEAEATADLLGGGAVPVYDAWPASVSPSDYIVLGDCEDGMHTYPVMKAARKKREERYYQMVHFVTHRPGLSATDAKAAALALFNYLEDEIADDPAIGLGATEPTLRLLIERFELRCTTETTYMGWRCQINAYVLVNCRLG